MYNNDILRRLRYALDLRDAELAAMMNHWPEAVSAEDVEAMLHKEQHDDFRLCSDRDLRALDGLIIARRGLRDPDKPVPPVHDAPLTNNDILKKLRIAMSFKQDDMLRTLEAGGHAVSPPELGALFRKHTHRHYRPCGDQLLRAFLAGLALQMRAPQD